MILSTGTALKISSTNPERTSPVERNKPTLPASRASPITFHEPASYSVFINLIHFEGGMIFSASFDPTSDRTVT